MSHPMSYLVPSRDLHKSGNPLNTIAINGSNLTEKLFHQIKFIGRSIDDDDVLNAIQDGEGDILGYCLEPIYDDKNVIGQHKQYLVIVNKILYRVCANTIIDDESETLLIEDGPHTQQIFYS